MKKPLTTLALLAFSMTSALALAPPYSSNFFESSGNNTIDTGWTDSYSNRKAKKWQYDNDEYYISAGKTGGAIKAYDSDYAADCWMFSPAITLQAGTTYTMSVLAQTRGSDSEAFEIKLGKDATTEYMKNGIELYRNAALMNPNSYTIISKEFTVPETGDYHFGFHCFSEANHFALYLTGFSVTEGEGGGEEPGPVIPDPTVALPLPWEENFETGIDDWTLANGPETSVSATWEYNSWNNSIKMDFTDGSKEDQWAISPALNFAEPGTYALETSGLVYGKLVYKLGTDKTDLTSFSEIIGTQECEDYDRNDKFVFNVSAPGTYHVAIQACADAGTYMGYRISSIKVKSQKKTLVNIDDLTVKSFEKPAKAELSATYPYVYNNGEALDIITKAEILRDGTVISTVTNPAPGSALSYTDIPEQPGTYTYSVKVYGKDGLEPEGEPMQVKSGYLGKPFMDVPVEAITLKDLSAEEQEKWVLDGWKFGYYYLESESESTGEVNHLAITPYMHLEPQKYRLTLYGKTISNGYKVMLCTNRNDFTDGVIEIYSCNDETEPGYFDRVIEFSLDQEGDYALAILHKTCFSSYNWNKKMEYETLKLRPIVELPQSVTDLRGELNEECTEATLFWINPTKTNFGSDIEGEISIKVKRDEEIIGTLKGQAGQPMQYTDQTVADHGKHTYGIITANENGNQEDEIPVVELDFEVPAEYPYVADFNTWDTGNSGNWWEIGEEDGYLKYRESTTGYADYAVSPLLQFKADEKYEVTAVFENSTAALNMRFGSSKDGMGHNIIHKFPAPASEAEETMKILISCTGTSGPQAYAETEGDDDIATPAETEVSMTPSKGYISMHMASSGHICLKSFSIARLGSSPSVVETIFANGDGISYANSTAYLPEGTESYTIYDLNGSILLTGTASESIDLTDLSGTLVITARTSVRSHTLKVMK